jgi:hypothetical protein
MWRALAGDQAEEMLVSLENTCKYLRDQSWKLRLAAISIMRMEWKAYAQLALICEQLAVSDPHPQVRETALFTLACCFRGTSDPRIGNLLAEIVSDTTTPDSFRQAAYLGLFQVRGMPRLTVPMPGKHHFPDDIDWDFVESFIVRDPKQD